MKIESREIDNEAERLYNQKEWPQKDQVNIWIMKINTLQINLRWIHKLWRQINITSLHLQEGSRKRKKQRAYLRASIASIASKSQENQFVIRHKLT